MIRAAVFSFLTLFVVFNISSQDSGQGQHSFVIRGEVFADLEPIYAGHVDDEYPLDVPAASRRALEEAALFYSAMIYGWTFHYEIGERARRIDENLELTPVAMIEFGDTALRVTDTEVKDMRVKLWTDYHLSEAQQRRMQSWRTGRIRNAQAIGYGPVEIEEYPGWLELKKLALEDAARVALRTMLRGSERNRPREVTGFISLASFPRYFVQSGRWAVSARFRVQIEEIVPYAVH